jgi:hypothetical protein
MFAAIFDKAKYHQWGVPNEYGRRIGDKTDPALLEAYQANLTFTTKEEYLTWRTAWRKEYAEVSDIIRGKLAPPPREENKPARLPWHYPKYARALLQLRALSKQRAQDQYLKAKTQVIL